MIRFIRLILFVQLLVFSGLASYSQTPEELKKQADALFEQGKFIEATPLYSKLLTLSPTDHDLNFKYGTCLLYNSRNKSEAIRHLLFSVKNPGIDKRAYFYLGRAYHLNYQFNEAIVQYEKFKASASPTQLKEFEVDQQIIACKNGKKLLSNITDMIVMKKTEIRREDFYEIYDLANIGGNILVTDEFQTKLDKQKGHRSVIHFPSNSPAIYYSSYGSDGSNGLDIYVVKKLPDGKYSIPQKVQGGVNTPYDEDYAYMHPDGRYLYFCSKGHNSMGGYDVFRCAYDERNNTFGPAENLDFAISSPDDDILFIVDSLDRVAYFSSARESQDGKIFVYQVRVERIPLQIAVIKGSFVNSIFAANKVVSIEVQSFSTGETIGTFNSKESNGDYLITFPKPGKYIYLVTVKGSDVTHKAIVDIPFTSEFKPLKQRITVARDDNGEEYVKIENLFNEAFDDPIAVMAEIYRELSTLMPNSSLFDIDSLNEANKNNDVFTEAGLDPFLTKEDVEKVVNDEIKELENSIKEDEKNSSIAYNLAEAKSDSANTMMVEINKMIDEAENATDPTEKTRILNDVNEKTNQVEKLNQESKDLVALGNEIDKSIDQKEISLNQANDVKTDLGAAPTGDKDALGNVVAENKTFFVENVKDNSPHENVVDEIIQSNTEQANSAQKLNGEIAQLRNEKSELEKKNESLENQLSNTKNKKEIEALEQQILDNTNKIEGLKIQIAEKEKQYDKIIQTGDNSQLGNAAVIVENPRNDTPENTNPLSDPEKNAITTKVENNNLDENIADVNQVLKENNIGGPKLDLFSSNETTKNYNLQQWNSSIDSEIDRLKTEKLSATPEERIKIDQEIQRYEDLKTEKKAEFDRVENPDKISPVINKEDIVTGYTTKKEEINRITDEEKRHNENLNLNQQLRDELLNEKANLQKVLDENPGNKNVQERIANIDKMLGEVNAEIATDENWIRQNTGTVLVNTEKIVASVDPGYQNKVNEIYKITDPEERANQMKILNESFTDRSNERVQELEAYVQSNPNDAVSKAELTELQRLNQQIATDSTQPLVKPVVLDIAVISPKVTPDQLVDDYTDRKTDIAKITDPYQRREAENNLNTELSNEIRNEIRELEKIQAENPGNTNITDRITNLKKLDDQLNSSIVSNESWMKSNPPTDKEIVQESDVKIVNPDYQAEVDRIEKIQNPEEKKEAIENLNTTTVEKIDDRINQLDQTLAQNPDDKSALEEKKELTELKIQLQNNPNKTATQPTDVSSINTKPTIDEIMPDYQDKMNSINASDENTIEKEKDKIALNQNLVSLIDNEINNLNNAKTENPDAAKDIDKRITSLNSIKNIKLDEIDASKTKIEDSVVPETSQITANSVLPGYDQKMNDIQKNSSDEKTKLTAENTLNNQLVAAIDAKTAELEKKKQDNPSNAAAIDKDLTSLQNLKTQKQIEINQNNLRINEIESGNTSSRPAVNISSVMPDYETKKNAIDQNSSDEKTKLTDKNNLNNQLILLINTEISELEKEKAENPANAAAIDRDIQTLQNIKTQKQIENGQNNDRIRDIESGTTSSRPAVSINSIMPDYLPKMNEIDQKSSDEKTKLTEKNALNNQLISAIDSEIADLQKEKTDNPANTASIDKDIQTLQNIKTQKQNEISQNNDRIRDIESGTTSSRPAVSINSVMPDYLPKMNEIDQKSSDEKTKLTEKNALNNQLISAIDSEIADLQKEKTDNPANTAAIDKDIQTLQNIKTQKQNEISQNSDRIRDIESGTTSSRPAVSINSVMPAYVPKMNEIDQKSSDEKTKLTEKNALNNQLISAIDSEIADLQKEKADNPANAAAIDKDIQTLQNIKTQKQNEISQNNDRIRDIESGTTSSRPAVSINSVMPDYVPKMNEIDQKSSDEKTKLTEKNALNNQLISAIDSEIADLQKEKADNPANAAAIDKDIQTLQNIKTQKQNETSQNNDRIRELDSTTSPGRNEISINTLMPSYEPGIKNINASNESETKKLEQKNALNRELISAIDTKISELNAELKTNSSQASAIQQEIDKLEELKESKTAEISKNNDLIKSMESGDLGTRSVSETTTEDFSSQEGKDVIAGHESSVTEIKAIDQDIEDLNTQLANTTDPKEQAKIEKQIDKKESTQARLENEILEDLATVNQAEYNDQKTETEISGDIATAKNPGDPSITEANQNIAKADQLMAEAQQLRNEAATEKDPVIANEKLELAFEKEQEAKNLIEQANRTFKTAEVIDGLNANNETVITSVPENLSDRESAQLFDQAASLDAKANELNQQATELRDNSLTAKKKYREAMVIEAQKLDSTAAVYRDEANAIRTEANQIKAQEDAILEALPETSDRPVDQATVNDVIATNEYKDYYDAKTSGDSNLFRAEEIGNEIQDLETKKQRIIKDAIVEYGTGPELEKALASNTELTETQTEIDRLTELQKQYRDKALADYEEAGNVLDKTDSQTRDNIVAISDRDLPPVEKVIVTLNPSDADYKAPEQLNTSIFRTTDGNPVYNSEKPIPVDQQQPSGLVYKVQVGAFRQPLPPEYFNKFAPISGQKIGDGITRYMVGYFTNFTVADNSKEQVHDLGYSDAFVVAYCNGQRISVAEAKEIEAGRKECPGTNLVAVNNMSINETTTTTTGTNNTNTAGNTNTTNAGGATNPVVTPTTNEEKQLTSYYTSSAEAAPANQVEIIKGLFFTVQIGVYSNPVKASLLYNITPLNSQLTENNKIRYTTGIYCNQQDAITRKNEIVQIGITDAFVTAYYNGKRITVAEANELIAKNGSSILFDCASAGNQANGTITTNQNTTDNSNPNTTNTTNQNTTDNSNQNTTDNTNQNTTDNTNQNQTTSTTGSTDTSGLWRVRVGYFENEVPQDFIELLLNHQDEGIVSESDKDENITFYTIPFSNKTDAEIRKNDLVQKGFVDAETEKMPAGVDELGNKIPINETTTATTKEIYYKEGVYYRIVIGKYSSEIPGEYATILLQTENILETEVDADGNTYIISTKINDFATVKERLTELNDLGIETMEIVTYYKYDPISFEQGNQILNDQPIDSLQYFPAPVGISADPYLYDKNAIYFRINLGKFKDQVPQEFANLLFENSDENILREETFDGETYFYTENIKSYDEAKKIYDRLISKGFKDAKLVAYHKFDIISVEKARQLLSNK